MFILLIFPPRILVMGAGIVVPLQITKDVTFPNYELPEVDAVRTAWKFSSFIVINKETVDEIYKGKLNDLDGILAGAITRYRWNAFTLRADTFAQG